MEVVADVAHAHPAVAAVAVQTRASPTAARVAIRVVILVAIRVEIMVEFLVEMCVGMGAAMCGKTVRPMETLRPGAIPISHHAMMQTLSRAMMPSLPITRHATSVLALLKSATAPAAAVVMEEVLVVVVGEAVSVAKRHAHLPKVDNLTPCAPVWT